MSEKKEVTIHVNGRDKIVHKEDMPYEEIVALAFDTPSSDSTIFVVTYRKGHGQSPEGTLVAGGTVKIKDGMIFNVTPTNRA